MKQIQNIVSETKAQLSKITSIENSYHNAVKNANDIPYQDMRADKLKIARLQFDNEKETLKNSIIQGVNKDIESIKEKVTAAFIKPIDSNIADTLQLWLSAEKVSEIELRALAKQYQGEPLALRIIGQIAKKHNYQTSSFSLPSRSLEDYSAEIDGFANTVNMFISTYLGAFLKSVDANNQYRQSILQGIADNATKLENTLMEIIG